MTFIAPRGSAALRAASLLVAGVALVAFGTLAPGLASAQTKLKWAHVYEVSEPFHTESVWAAEEIKKRTDGKYDIQVFPASPLGKEADINQGLTLGTVDMIISGPSFAARSTCPIGVTYYPYIFRDGEHLLAYTKSDVFKGLAEGYGRRPASRSRPSPITARARPRRTRPIKKCADLEGVKIRVPDVPAYLAMPQACGANTAPIAFAEVYLALQNGTVEAQENPLTTIEAKKFYEVQKHIVLTGHIVDHLNTSVSPHVWATLSRRGQGDLHRGDAGGRRARHEDQGTRGRAGRDLPGPRDQRHRGRQELRGGRAEEQAGQASATTRRTGTRSRPSSKTVPVDAGAASPRPRRRPGDRRCPTSTRAATRRQRPKRARLRGGGQAGARCRRRSVDLPWRTG